MTIIPEMDSLVKSTQKEVFHLFLDIIVRNIIFDHENHFFANLTLVFTF